MLQVNKPATTVPKVRVTSATPDKKTKSEDIGPFDHFYRRII